MLVRQRLTYFFCLGWLLTSLFGCAGEDGNTGATALGYTGATALLSWEPVDHHAPVTYTVHYGPVSIGNMGLCEYEQSLDVSEPSATVAGLAFETTYYFAVSAVSNGSRSACSNEVSKFTATQQEPIDDSPGNKGNNGKKRDRM